MRPRKRRHIRFDPVATYFKPRGIPMKELRVVEILPDELEALRLKYILGLDQTGAAKKMRISQSTLQRALVSAKTKLARALTKGMAIKLVSRNCDIIGACQSRSHFKKRRI